MVIVITVPLSRGHVLSVFDDSAAKMHYFVVSLWTFNPFNVLPTADTRPVSSDSFQFGSLVGYR